MQVEIYNDLQILLIFPLYGDRLLTGSKGWFCAQKARQGSGDADLVLVPLETGCVSSDKAYLENFRRTF